MKLTAMSFNIRYDKPDPDERNWRVRREAVAALIAHYSPDIIGTQEARANQLLDLHRLLPKYQSLGSDRRGTGLDEHCAILYQPSRLQCLEIYEFWLSETPDIIGSITEAWGNPYPRMVTGAKFGTLEGQTLQFYNTHLDYYSDKAKDLGAKCIQERFCQLDLTKDYLFLTGDFNVNSQQLPRQILTQPLQSEIKLKDALADLELAEQMSFNNYTDTPYLAIDTIYYDNRLQLDWAKVDPSRWLNLIPSDHYPVIAAFTLP
ncbi:endonuclease/exonuclease/phosphatase family protein [Microcystis sp. M49636_WE2]|uniref:endonuclease/exonuclease/phosphatase family protein n=1 Tax=Microcystis sp. M49636_WE2 TaxID=3030679 RepID=UPI0025853FC2|nr:endonuclease/exonuclease/phosphatase family protein [Microcystis sp. M49636_WE2]MDJ0584153.1 endonuclease/exonuclease/phosphatase family protein [Microcystis sp. M49636_WE2]